MWLYIVLNIVQMIYWAFLAVVFDKWWLVLFTLLFISVPKEILVKKHCRICDKCGKHSPYADTPDEAIEKAQKNGWVTFKEDNNSLNDYCPNCKKLI